MFESFCQLRVQLLVQQRMELHFANFQLAFHVVYDLFVLRSRFETAAVSVHLRSEIFLIPLVGRDPLLYAFEFRL